MNGTYFNIQRYCIHDGPGIRTTVFLKGCPLKCVWCHNPESQGADPELMFYGFKCKLCGRCLTVCPIRQIVADVGVSPDRITPENAKLEIKRDICLRCGRCVGVCPYDANIICGKTGSAEEVIAVVVRDKPFYKTSGGGLTVSGGEPAFQPEFTLELLRLAAENGISGAVETSGFGEREFFEKAADAGTLFLYDLKEMDSVKHRRLTGVDNALILENLEYLFSRNADVIIRMPLVPNVNDGRREIELLSDFLKKYHGKYRYAEIMQYHKLGNSKLESLGRSSELLPELPTDEVFGDMWLKVFAENGLEDIKISR